MGHCTTTYQKCFFFIFFFVIISRDSKYKCPRPLWAAPTKSIGTMPNPRRLLLLCLLLPAVLVLAWEGLGALLQRRAATMVALLLLLAGNAWLSPVDHTGHRAVWGGSGERWYGYTDCLADLRKLKHNARLAIANVAHSYGIGMTLQRLDWWVHVSNLPVANPNDALATLQAALTLAAKGEFDFVIFRWETDPPIALDHQHAGYVRMRDYPSQGGTLTVFARRASGFQSPTP